MTSPHPARNAAKRLADASEGPWKAWKIRTRHGRAIKFIETYCSAPKGKGHGVPLKLAKFQKAWLEESLADGVDASVLQTPRGNGKSSLGGGLATWALFDDDETGAPQVPIIATTVGQAIRSCYGVAVSMIKAEAELYRRAHIFTGIGTSRVHTPSNGGDMFPMSNDPDGLQGLDYSLAIVDEIGFQPIESWDSLRLASGKRERSLVAGLGTPGLDRENALHHLRTLVKEGAIFPGFVYREYSAPDTCAVDDRGAWRVANPALAAGFLRLSALETDIGITPEGHFRTFRLGQWVEGVDSWLGANGGAIWEGLTNPYEFNDHSPTYVGADLALGRTETSDTSAVVAIQQRPDGRWHVLSRVWVPTRDRPLDMTDVMQYIRDLASAYRVVSVGFDPRFFDVPAKMLEGEGIAMTEITQTPSHMTPAYVELRRAIMEGKITHDGDEILATHVLNGVIRSSGDNAFMLDKGKSRGKIDAAVAMTLAYDQALRHESEEPSVYEERGLVTV